MCPYVRNRMSLHPYYVCPYDSGHVSLRCKTYVLILLYVLVLVNVCPYAFKHVSLLYIPYVLVLVIVSPYG